MAIGMICLGIILSAKNGEFSPDLDSVHVRPQIPLGLTVLSLSVVVDNLNAVVGNAANEEAIRTRLVELVERAGKLDARHE